MLASLDMESHSSQLSIQPHISCLLLHAVQERASDRASIEQQLAAIEERLQQQRDASSSGSRGGSGGPSLLQSGGLTLADVAVACALLPLFQSVLGQEAQAAYPATCQWLLASSKNPHFSKVLGACRAHLSVQGRVWVGVTAMHHMPMNGTWATAAVQFSVPPECNAYEAVLPIVLTCDLPCHRECCTLFGP